MKYLCCFSCICFLVLIPIIGASNPTDLYPKYSSKGNLYAYWGYNNAAYTNSDISFKGDNYNFTLKRVVAHDRQTKFALDPYFNPLKFTIPQYNFRVGYFISNNWDISFGVDHMKYVVDQFQTDEINGEINVPESPYSKIYTKENIILSEDFLKFEHTDGLNYINIEVKHSSLLLHYKQFKLNIKEGLGIGIIIPRTNVTLLENERYDEFHLAGYGIAPTLNLNATFFDLFFIQTEAKFGYINMPDIRTTSSSSDRASQHFLFAQYNLVLGLQFKLHKN